MQETREGLSLEPVANIDNDEKLKNSESFDVIDYVRELFLNSEEQKKIEQKKLKLMRVCVALVSLVTVVIVVSAGILVPMLFSTVSEANKALIIVQDVDIKTLASNIDALALKATDTLEVADAAVKSLNELDMQSLNATIAELKTGVESFSKIDIVTLNAAIANLNATVEPFAKFFGK